MTGAGGVRGRMVVWIAVKLMRPWKRSGDRESVPGNYGENACNYHVAADQ